MLRRVSIAALLSCACAPHTSPPAEAGPSRADPVVVDEPQGPHNFAYQIGGSGIDSLADAALGRDGSVALVGEFDDYVLVDDSDATQVILSEDLRSSIGGSYVAIQDLQGKTRWARTIHQEGTLVTRSVAVAPDGDVVVAGWFDGTVKVEDRTLEAHSEKQELYSRGDEDGFIARYTPDGVLRALGSFGGPGGLDISDLAIAPNGDMIIAGGFTGPLTFGEQSIEAPSDIVGRDAFVIRLDDRGNSRWLKKIGGDRQDKATNLAVTADDQVVVAGECQATIDLGAGSVDCNEHGGNVFVATLGAEGAITWSTVLRHHEPKDSTHDFTAAPTGLAPLSDGGLLVTAMFVEQLELDASTTLESSGWTDAAMIRYDAKGHMQWARTVGWKDFDRLGAPVADAHGGAWIAGHISGPPSSAFGQVLPGEGMQIDAAPGTLDPSVRWPRSAIFVHIDAAGTWTGAIQLGADPSSVEPPGTRGQEVAGRHVFVDPAGRLRLVGMFTGVLDVPQIPEMLLSRGRDRVGNEDDAFVASLPVPAG